MDNIDNKSYFSLGIEKKLYGASFVAKVLWVSHACAGKSESSKFKRLLLFSFILNCYRLIKNRNPWYLLVCCKS